MTTAKSTRRPRWIACALVASAIFAGSLTAGAQQGDKVLAESLFQAGKSLMAEGKYDQACPKFVESQKQDPSPGTLLNLGKCHEAQGKSASAWAEYKEAAAMARAMGRAEQETAANERVTVLEPKLSKLKIDAPPADIPGLTVKRDGAPTGVSSLGIAIPVDPGEHTIEASAAGYKTWSGKITVGKDGDSKSIAIPALEKGEEPPGGGAAPGVGPAGGSTEAPTDTTGGSSRRTIGFVVGGVGVAAVGLGAVFGLMAAGQASSAQDDPKLCPNKVCTKAGTDEIDGAKTKALVSTIGFGVGIAAIGAGVILIVTAPKKSTGSVSGSHWASVVPSIGPTGGGAAFVGAF